MWPNLQFPADLVLFTEEILNGKLRFLCSVLHIIAYTFGITNIHRIGKSGVVVGLIWEEKLLYDSKL